MLFLSWYVILLIYRMGRNEQKANQFPPKDTNMIKLIITDLDGAFLNNQGD